jgi:K+-transporting ATPase ATPase C chain
MIRETLNALAACALTFLLCAVAYPAAVWGLGQFAFPREAEGSLIYGRDRTVIGSELIAQPFASERYFFPRPSAVDYKADATGGSNLGTKNPDLRKKIAERAEALKATDRNPAPVDLVTASGGGMDPHITPEAAVYQAARVAAARKTSVDRVKALIDRHTDRSGAIIGAPARVNVLLLNLALDHEDLTQSAAASTVPGDTDSSSSPAGDRAAASVGEELTAVREQIGRLSAQVGKLAGAVDAVARSDGGGIKARDALKSIDDRLARLSDEARALSGLSGRIDGLEKRLSSADREVRQLSLSVQKAVDALAPLGRPSPLANPPGARPGAGRGGAPAGGGTRVDFGPSERVPK